MSKNSKMFGVVAIMLVALLALLADRSASVFAQGGGEGETAGEIESEREQAPTFRTINGSGNNVANDTWGQINTQLGRLAGPAYEDGFSEPRGGGVNQAATQPNPRTISNAVSDQSGEVPNSQGVSDMLWQWGQFLDHDIDLTTETEPEEHFNIPVPAGDPVFQIPFMGLNRSKFDTSTGTTNARQQINEITTWIDASQVYASEDERASWKRSPTGNSIGGRLNTSAGNLLPFEADGFFGAGDIRANEQIGLTSLHTLFMREHNRLAALIAANHPSFTDEQIYQRARALVGAQMQMITYGEYHEALLGPNALPAYDGYQDDVDPAISNEFSTAAYRFGHTMLPSVLLRLDSNGNEIANGHVSLRDAFFNNQPIIEDGIEPVLRGLAAREAQEIDTLIIDDVRNFLFANVPGSPGFDLAALNIQRGRDHGLATYNVTRQAIGLTPAASFADITPDAALQAQLAAAYNNDVNLVDLWVGGLAEDHVNGSLLGETFQAIVVNQFTRLRDADRFWHEEAVWTLAGFESDPIVHGDPNGDHTKLSQVRLSDIIRWNTSIDNIQENVFMAQPVPPSTDVIYVSSHTDGTIGGFSAADEDVLIYDQEDDTQSAYPWSWHINLDYVGITSDIDALHVMPDGTVLMSFESTTTVPALGSVRPEDVVRFVPSNTGEETIGYFQWYLDGSDIGLDASSENIDAIGLTQDDRLLVSTSGGGSVPDENTGGTITFTAQDLIVLAPTHLGSSTSGRWQMYFDASDVELTSGEENVVGVWVNPQSGEIYLTTSWVFSVNGLSGQGYDIFVCEPALLGDITSCADFSLFFDGSEQGLTTGNHINGFSLELVEGSETPRLYLTTSADPSVGQTSFNDEDIVGFDTRINRWRVYFDGSDVGVTGDVNGFLVLTDSILMTFDAAVTLPGAGGVTPSDIVRFVPSMTGENTAGSFELYFEGADVDLSGANENIDAIGLTSDGRLLISVAVSGGVTDVSDFSRADILAFTPTSLGATTSGTWELYFHGKDVLLESFDAENVAGVWVHPTDTGTGNLHDLYLTTWGSFSLSGGLSGEGRDIFACSPHSLGSTTACIFSIFFDGSSDGFRSSSASFSDNFPSGHAIDGISVGGELCVMCNELPDRPEQIYVSSDRSGSIGGVALADEDIVTYRQDTSAWESLFDGSLLGIAGDINAFLVLADQSILLSFETTVAIDGLGSITPQDIVRFVPANTGSDTPGQFEWYFNGSDVELTTTSENIDAIAQTPDGRLLISVTGNGNVTGVPLFKPQDIVAFTPTQLGAITTGVWEMYFEGDDVWLSSSTENIDGLWVDPAINQDTGLPENIYFSTSGNFSVLELTGDGVDLVVCKPFSLGYSTGCLFEVVYDGSAHGLSTVDGFSLDGQTTDYYFSVSSNSNITVGQIGFDDEDVLLYNARSSDWSLYFDGSDVGLANNNVNAALVLDNGEILISLGASMVLPGVGSVDPQDIVRFVPTSTGQSTAGSFEWYFDGSDVGLETSVENIDAIALAPNGELLISIIGDASVPGITSFWDEDLLIFTATQLGQTTEGTWAFYFDGSDVGLANSGNEDLWGAWVDGTTGAIYLNTLSSFGVTGVSGDGTDVFVCMLGAVGETTACAFDSFLDGSTVGLAGHSLDGISLEEDVVCYDLTVTPDEATAEGSVSVYPSPNCDGTKYRAGTVVMLTANPTDDYSFAGWSGDAAGSTNPLNVAMDGDKSIEANFVLETACYPLATASAPANGGNVNATPASNCDGAGGPGYLDGTVVTLSPLANANYSFDEWSGDATGSISPIAITMNITKSVTANFVSCHTLTTAADPAAGGSVAPDPAPNCAGGTYLNGTTVELTGNPNPGYEFDAWSGDATGQTNPISVTMDADKSVTASFVAAPCYTLTTGVDPAASGTIEVSPAPDCVSDNTKYMANATVTLTATGSADYMFKEWRDDASAGGTNNPTTLTIDGNKTATAHFMQEAQCEIVDIQITNVRDVAFTVSWLTTLPGTSEVRYGTDMNNLDQTAYDVRGQGTSDETHYVTIAPLSAATTYYFDVVSCDGNTTDDNAGNHYSVTTGPTLNPPPPETVFGEVFETDGATVAEGAIVYITLKDNDGNGTLGEAAPLSAIVNNNGFWFTSLSNARLGDLSGLFDKSANGDELELVAKGGVDECDEETVDTANDMPATDLVLEECNLVVDWPVDVLEGWNFMAFALDLSFSVEEICDEIDANGGALAEGNRWLNGGWEGHICQLPFADFDLELGQGYFVRANQASAWMLQGYNPDGPVTLNILEGWNSISVPDSEGYTAETLCQEIISQGVTAVEIDRWHNGGWEGHLCGLPFGDFPIQRGAGYFLKASNAGAVTPPTLYRQAALVQGEENAPEAAPVMAVNDLHISNLRDTSLTLSWTTERATTGYVRFGESVGNRDELPLRNQVAYDTRGASSNSTTHYVVLSHLKAQTTYDIQIISGAETADSVVQSITTPPTLEDVPNSDTVYGKVLLSDGQTPATGALVHLQLQDADGQGSSSEAMPLSAIVDENGYWRANLGNARTADLSGSFSYSASGDQLLVEAHASEHGTTSQIVDTADDGPALDLAMPAPTAVEVGSYTITQPSTPWLGTFMALTLLFSVISFGWYRRKK